jgi:hypothetical protein
MRTILLVVLALLFLLPQYGKSEEGRLISVLKSGRVEEKTYYLLLLFGTGQVRDEKGKLIKEGPSYVMTKAEFDYLLRWARTPESLVYTNVLAGGLAEGYKRLSERDRITKKKEVIGAFAYICTSPWENMKTSIDIAASHTDLSKRNWYDKDYSSLARDVGILAANPMLGISKKMEDTGKVLLKVAKDAPAAVARMNAVRALNKEIYEQDPAGIRANKAELIETLRFIINDPKNQTPSTVPDIFGVERHSIPWAELVQKTKTIAAELLAKIEKME